MTKFFFFIDHLTLDRLTDITSVDYFKVILRKAIREKSKFDKFLVHGIKKLIRDSPIMNR